MPEGHRYPPRSLMLALLLIAIAIGIAAGYWVFTSLG
jgi:hypothetical protein